MTPHIPEIGQLHQVFIHFPIILFTLALICDLLHGMGKKMPFLIGHWLIIAGVIFCIPTIITGQEAAKAFPPVAYLEKHRFLGFATGIAASLYSGLRIGVMRWKLKISPIFFIGLSVLMVALVSWTSDYGGLITQKRHLSEHSKATN